MAESQSIERLTEKEAINIQMGQGGGTYITDTTAYTSGSWRAIYHYEETVYTTLTSDITIAGSTFPGAFAFPAGTWIFGKYTAITLARGRVMAFNG